MFKNTHYQIKNISLRPNNQIGQAEENLKVNSSIQGLRFLLFEITDLFKISVTQCVQLFIKQNSFS